MLTRLLKRCLMFTSKITPQNYHQIAEKFASKPELSTFGEYFDRENVVQIYNIIRNTTIQPKLKIQQFEKVEGLCTQNEEMDFNILANLCRQKALIHFSLQNQSQAVNQIQKAIQSILCMENPHQFQLAMLYLTSSNILTQCGEYGRAEKALKEAQNIIIIFQDQVDANDQQIFQGIHFILAQIYTNYCFLKLKTKKGMQAKMFMEKAMEEWKQLPNKNNSSYQTTIKYKCLLHSELKENSEAVQTAEDYLAQFEETDQNALNRLWFQKFLSHYDDKYKDELKSKLQSLRKVLPPKVFEDVLTKLGFLHKSK